MQYLIPYWNIQKNIHIYAGYKLTVFKKIVQQAGLHMIKDIKLHEK